MTPAEPTDNGDHVMVDSAEAAAAWWAAKVGGRPWHDNGDREQAGFVAGALMEMIASRDRPNITTIDRFAAVLAERVRDMLTRTEWGVTLSTDYGPDGDLAAAAEASGLAFSQFPWKTVTWVHHDHLVVSDGYQGRYQVAWSAPGYVPPPCHNQAYDPVTYDPAPGKCGQLRYHDGDCDTSVASPLCASCGRPEHRHSSWDDHPFQPQENARSSDDG